jgi:hypothetical protein
MSLPIDHLSTAKEYVEKLSRANAVVNAANAVVNASLNELATQEKVRGHMFWHGVDEHLPQPLSAPRPPDSTALYNAFVMYPRSTSSTLLAIQIIAPALMKSMMDLLGRSEQKIAESKWHAIFGFSNKRYAESNLNSYIKNHSTSCLKRADFDIEGCVNIDYQQPSCIVPDFLTVRSRLVLAINQAEKRDAAKAASGTRRRKDHVAVLSIADCLHWTTADGKVIVQRMIASANGFYQHVQTAKNDEPDESEDSNDDESDECEDSNEDDHTPTKKSYDEGKSASPPPKPVSASSRRTRKPSRRARNRKSRQSSSCPKCKTQLLNPKATNKDEPERDSNGQEAADSEEDGNGCEESGTESKEPSVQDTASGGTHHNCLPTDFHGPIYGKNLSASDVIMNEKELDEAMAKVDEFFHQTFASNFIDVILGITSQEKAGQFDPSNHKIQWYHIKVPDVQKVVSYWSFDNAISPFLKNRMFQSGNDNAYMSSSEVNPQGNSIGNRFLRFADLAGPDQFFHLKSMKNDLFGTELACATERDLMKCISCIMKVMDEAIEAAAAGKQFPRYRLRQLQILLGTPKGAAYATHDDSSPTQNHESKRHEVGASTYSGATGQEGEEDAAKGGADKQTGKTMDVSSVSFGTASLGDTGNSLERQSAILQALPSRFEMRVPTVTMCNVKPGVIVSYIDIYSKSAKKNSKPLLSIPCGGCTIHLQGFGAQLYTNHRVRVARNLPTFSDSQIIRMVCSARDPLHHQHPSFELVFQEANLLVATKKPIRKYHYRNVASSLVEKTQPTASSTTTQPTASSATTTYDFEDIFPLADDSIPDYKPTQAEKESGRFTLEPPAGFLQSQERIDQILLNRTFQKKLREMKIEVVVQDKGIAGGSKSSRDYRHGRVPSLGGIHKIGATSGETSSGVLQRGDIVSTKDILNHYTIEKNDRHKKHTWNSGHSSFVNHVVLAHNYKNDFVSLHKMQEILAAIAALLKKLELLSASHSDAAEATAPAASDISQIAAESEEYLQSNAELIAGIKKDISDKWAELEKIVLWMGGSGGALRLNGASAVKMNDLPTGVTNIPSGYLPRPQDPTNALNSVMSGVVARQGVVSLYCQARKEDMPWRHSKASAPPESASDSSLFDDDHQQYLGEYTFTGNGGQQKPEPIYNSKDFPINRNTDGKRLIQESEMDFLSFRSCVHFKWYLQSFGKEGANDEDETVEWKQIHLNLTDSTSSNKLGFSLDGGKNAGLEESQPKEQRTKDMLKPGAANGRWHHDVLAEVFVEENVIDDYIGDSVYEQFPSASVTKIGKKNRKRHLSPAEAVDLMVHLQVAITARALRMNLHDVGQKGKPSASILFHEEFIDSLGAVLRSSTTPAAARVTDVTTSFWLLMCLNSLGHKLPDQSSYTEIVPPNAEQKWYCVLKGRNVGVYQGWTEARKQVHRYSRSRHRAFDKREDAEKCLKDGGGGTSNRNVLNSTPTPWKCVHANDLEQGDMDALLLTSVLLRVTGRPEPWVSFFENDMGWSNKGPALLRTREDVEKFCRHLCSMNGGRWTSKLRNTVSDQMSKSVPEGVTRTPHSFRNFALSLFGCIQGFWQKWSNIISEKDEDSRKQVQLALQQALECCPGCTSSDISGGKTLFLAGIVLADLEEIVDEPVGPVRYVHLGYGGKEGYESIYVGGDAGTEEKEHTINFVLDAIVAYVNNSVDDAILELLGLCRISSGTVVYKINLRPYSRVDAEHLLCKLYIVSQIARGTRAYNNHRCARPHCHPVLRPYLHPEELDVMFKCTMDCFRKLRRSGDLPPIPYLFTLQHERYNESSLWSKKTVSLRQKTVLDLMLQATNESEGAAQQETRLRLQSIFGPKFHVCSTQNKYAIAVLEDKFNIKTLNVSKNNNLLNGGLWEGINIQTTSQFLTEQVGGSYNPCLQHVINQAKAEVEAIWLSSSSAEEMGKDEASTGSTPWREDEEVHHDDNHDEEEEESHLILHFKTGISVLYHCGELADAFTSGEAIDEARHANYLPPCPQSNFSAQQMDNILSFSDGSKPITCYVPLHKHGMILYVWQADDQHIADGHLLFVPWGHSLLLPGDLWNTTAFKFGCSNNEHLQINYIPMKDDGTISTHPTTHMVDNFQPSIWFDECLVRRMVFCLLKGKLRDTDKPSTIKVFDHESHQECLHVNISGKRNHRAVASEQLGDEDEPARSRQRTVSKATGTLLSAAAVTAV